VEVKLEKTIRKDELMENNAVPKANEASGKLTNRSKQKAGVVPAGFRILTGTEEIKNAAGILQKKLAANAVEYKVSVVSLGKTCLVHWHAKLGFWSTVGVGKGGRIQMRFGLDYPRKRKTVALAAQFNIPMKGSRSAGAFVADAQGNIYLAHSGNIAPGLRGGGKRAFRPLYQTYGKRQKEMVTLPNGKKRWMILVTRLNDAQAAKRIGSFVRKVAKLKLRMNKSVARKRRTPKLVMVKRKQPVRGTAQQKTSVAVGTLPLPKPAVAS